MIEKISWQLRPVQFTSIIPHVENLGGDIEEKRKVAGNAVGNVCFAGGGEAAHDDDELFAFRAIATDDAKRGGVFSFGDDVRGGVVDAGP